MIVNGDLNYEEASLHTISVRLTDDGNLVKTRDFSIAFRNVNDPPRDILLSGTSINENRNSAIVGICTTIDEDAEDTFTYKLMESGKSAHRYRASH